MYFLLERLALDCVEILFTENKKWTLYWMDSNDRWHLYDPTFPGPIGKLLREIEADRTDIFWG